MHCPLSSLCPRASTAANAQRCNHDKRVALVLLKRTDRSSGHGCVRVPISSAAAQSQSIVPKLTLTRAPIWTRIQPTLLRKKNNTYTGLYLHRGFPLKNHSKWRTCCAWCSLPYLQCYLVCLVKMLVNFCSELLVVFCSNSIRVPSSNYKIILIKV